MRDEGRVARDVVVDILAETMVALLLREQGAPASAREDPPRRVHRPRVSTGAL